MKILLAIIRFFIARRYKVTYKGTEVLKNDSAKFILPNHQALVDPQILFPKLYRYGKTVPVVTESFFKNPVSKYILDQFEAVAVSDLGAGNRDKDVLKTISSSVVKALEEKKSVLLYPSGQIAGQGVERIFNKRGSWAVVQNMPEDAKVIGVRISGLWGSMWSKAWEGKSPDFFKTVLKAMWYMMTNFVFFLPKREVTVEFEDLTDLCKSNALKSKQEFNDGLESFYNQQGEEPVTFIKHYFYGKKPNRSLPNKIDGSIADVTGSNDHSIESVPDDVFCKVRDIVAKEAEINSEDIQLTSHLNLELSVDSITLVLIIGAIENEFNCVSGIEVTSIKTIQDLCLIAENKTLVDEVLPESLLASSNKLSERIYIDPNTTITNLLTKTFNRDKDSHFAYDKIMGTTTRKQFLLKANVVAKIIKKEVKGENVGIMLPALQSTTLLVAATYLAGKTPVMLNWTVGPKVLEHCVKQSEVEVILTAKTFLTKIEDGLTESVKSKCLYFEEKVRELDVFTKMSGLFSYFFKITPKVKPDDTAVVLFTSGSESLPKVVKLTHKNILSDLHGSIEHMKFSTDKIFLSFLPPFHSFGFTILTIFPMISGLKIAYTPDPTDSREVLKILKHTDANTLLGTPTFLKMLLSVATDDDMKNVVLAMSGAESLHTSVIDTFKSKANKEAIILEGYGITECAPILTINPIEKQKSKSVGTFIKGVDCIIADINTFEALPLGKEGMIVVNGDNIFNGYVDQSIANPFVEIDGIQYYKTGDLGYLDDEGYLYITGRLKRFIKIAGEMISLPAIESVLLEKYGADDKVVLAVEGDDTTETPVITLFTAIPLEVEQVNRVLKESGFSSLIKIHNKVEVEEIPLLGTGKTDYKALKGIMAST